MVDEKTAEHIDSVEKKSKRPRRHWYQFSMRTFLIFTTVVTLIFALWIEPSERQRRAASLIKQVNEVWTFDVKSSSGNSESSEWYQHYFFPIVEIGWHENDTAFVDWSALPRLRSLNLWGDCDKDKFLAQLPVLNELTHIDVNELNVTKLTDVGLRSISKHPNLDRLTIYDSRKITSAGISHLAKLIKLENLTLRGYVSDPDCTNFNKLQKSLRVLDLSKFISPEGARNISQLSSLEKLFLQEHSLIDAHLAHISQMQNLRHLSVGGQFTEEGIKLLLNLPKLEYLQLNTRLSAQSMEHLSQLHSLLQLDIRFSKLDESAFQYFSNFNKLEYLDTCFDVPRDLLQSISRIKTLKTLIAHSDTLDDRDMELLTFIQNLKNLDFNVKNVTDHGMKHIKKLKNLKRLRLYGKKGISDIGLAEIAELENLELLDLRNTSVTDAGLKYLTKLKKLKHVNLHGTLVTGTGIQTVETELPKDCISMFMYESNYFYEVD